MDGATDTAAPLDIHEHLVQIPGVAHPGERVEYGLVDELTLKAIQQTAQDLLAIVRFHISSVVPSSVNTGDTGDIPEAPRC